MISKECLSLARSLLSLDIACRWCANHLGILDLLFEKLMGADEATRALLSRWTPVRPRSHYVHE